MHVDIKPCLYFDLLSHSGTSAAADKFKRVGVEKKVFGKHRNARCKYCFTYLLKMAEVK